MPNTLLRVFNDFSAAQNARNALLSSGFPSSSVHLTSRDDEAGPVEGNFTVGDIDNRTSSRADVYERKFANVVQRGVYLLEVDADSDEEGTRASDIMNRFGEGV